MRIDLTQRFTGFLQALTLPAFAISSPRPLAAGTADVLNQTRGGQPVSAYATTRSAPDRIVFASWDSGSVTLASNKDYWGDRGQIGTIRFVTYDHPQTRLQALLDGKIDGYDAVTVGNFDQLVKRGKQIIQRDPFSVMYLGMNQEVPVLQNLKVRQAIELAHRQGHADPPVLHRQHSPGVTVRSAEAQRLQQQRAPRWATTRARPRNCWPRPATRAKSSSSTTRSTSPGPICPRRRKVYAEISRQLTAVGLNVKPVPVDWSDGYLQKVQSPGDHALHLLGWNGSYSDADNFVGPLFGEKNGEFGYQDPQVFSKIDRARGLPDGKERDVAVPDHQCADRCHRAGGPHRLPHLGAGTLGPSPEATRRRRC